MVLHEVGRGSHGVFRELAQGKIAVTARIFDQRDLRDDSVDWIIRASCSRGDPHLEFLIDCTSDFHEVLLGSPQQGAIGFSVFML